MNTMRAGRMEEMMAQAVMRSIAVNAARRKHRAQRLFAELLPQTESSRKILHYQLLERAIEYKVSWERELRRREMLGITDLPDPIPHHDHFRVDFCSGKVRFAGPMSKEEKAEWDDMLRRRQVLLESIDGLEEALETEDDPEEVADIRRYREIAREVIVRIEPLVLSQS